MPPENLVSRETGEKLEIYKELLLKWQARINLIAPSTIPDIEKRHFQDSLQISALIPENKIVYDLGSGAGFPGLVLAIDRPDLDITLIESDNRKCEFLRTVSRETSTKVNIYNGRIENSSLQVPEIITCRALASLEQILAWTEHWWRVKPVQFILLKGEKAAEEIKEAHTIYSFDVVQTPSISDERGMILRIGNIKES